MAAVVIGRNEGERLVLCLASLKGRFTQIVYVDSGSTDGSVQAAVAAGADVIDLDMTVPFTAARARNAGLSKACAQDPAPRYIQFLDGDCQLRDDWLAEATAFLDRSPDVAVVCGRRRERHPQATVYNSLIDREWDTPVGEAHACGGDALIRSSALQQVGGYDPNLIAGEEPELCLRLRRKGWKVWRLDAEMTLHDANITKFSQWWQRSRRAGHAYAEGAFMHGAGPEGHYKAQTRRALLWGAALPVFTIAAASFSAAGLMLLALWPAQVVRLRLRGSPWSEAFFLTLSKLPEAQGILGFYIARLKGRKTGLIEYK